MQGHCYTTSLKGDITWPERICRAEFSNECKTKTRPISQRAKTNLNCVSITQITMVILTTHLKMNLKMKSDPGSTVNKCITS